MQVKGYKFSSTQAYYDFVDSLSEFTKPVTKQNIDEAIVSWVLMFGLDGVLNPLIIHAPEELLTPLWRSWDSRWELVDRIVGTHDWRLNRIGKSYYKQLCKDINKVNKI